MVTVVFAAFGRAGKEVLDLLVERNVRIVCFTYDSPDNTPLLIALDYHKILTTTKRLNLRNLKKYCPNPDIIISMHYRHLIPASTLDLTRLGGFNLHPSLLPRYRGCFSAPWAIIHGEAKTGITYHQMNTNLDDGDIILQRQIKIRNNDTGYSLFQRLIDLGVSCFAETLDRVLEQRPTRPQIGEPSYYPRAVPFGGEIDGSWDLARIERFIRALCFPGKPPAFVIDDNGKKLYFETFTDYQQSR